MPQHAVDIVLLPSQEIEELCLRVNKKETEVELGSTDRIPHLSLMMGVLDTDDTDKLVALLERLTKDLGSVPVTSIGIRGNCLSFAQTEELQTLHEQIVKGTENILTHVVSDNMFQEEKRTEIPESVKRWPEKFPTSYSFESYNPHITLWGKDKTVEFPKEFTMPRIAICRLGNHNTCRDILWEKSLEKKN